MYIEFEEGKKFPVKDADISNTQTDFKDAGYLLTDAEIVVDIDDLDKETIEKMLVLFNIKTEAVETDRGYHLYFKKPKAVPKKANKVCGLGFPIELKHIKNTKAICTKRNGIERKVSNAGVREDLPEFFKIDKGFESLMGLGESDGRNQALFGHRAKLGHTKGWEQMLKFINSNIFAEPLDEKEFASVSREISFTGEKGEEGAVAEWFIDEYKSVLYMGNIHFKTENGRFESNIDKMRRIIYAKLGNVNTHYIKEVIEQVNYKSPLVEADKEFDIKFLNGVLRNGKFIPIRSEEFTPYVIDINYKKDAKPVKAVDDYMKHLTSSDAEYSKMIYEIMGHTLITNVDFKTMIAKFFIFVGTAGAGKGTLLKVIEKILNKENTSSLSVGELADERYLVTMTNKLANLGDDIQNEAINNEQMKALKNISTCDTISVRELYKQSQSVRITTSLIFTSNYVLKSFEKGGSYKRRVYWLPIYSVVKEEDKDANFMNTITSEEALEYWVSQIVEGYFRIYKQGGFTQAKRVMEYNKLYHEENNTALAYLEDYEMEHFKGKKIPEIMADYEVWCEENGLSVASRGMMAEALFQLFELGTGTKKIAGKSHKVLMLQSETKQDLKV